MAKIISINADMIYPHPDNPRKDLGDLSELTESIRKNGIMQNLTVMNGHFEEDGKWDDTGYTLLIGHRRCAAAKAAGLSKLPCMVIPELTKNEQVSMMLEENMQRNDLTIMEQAQGFQMMLDLGDTEEQIAAKTGFSRTTIRHRLNIAKLDQKILKNCETQKDFQLSLTDLYELEKIQSVETRNKILSEAYSSANLVQRAHNAVFDETCRANEKEYVAMITDIGLTKAPKAAENQLWSGKWETVKQYSLGNKPPENLDIPKRNRDKMYYLVKGSSLYIVKKDEGKSKPNKYEEEQRDRNARKKSIKAILKGCSDRLKRMIIDVIEGRTEPVKDEATVKNLWNVMVKCGTYVGQKSLRKIFLPKDNEWECTGPELESASRRVNELGMQNQMLIAIYNAVLSIDCCEWNGSYSGENGETLKAVYDAMKPYGWYFEKAEANVIDGSSELYVRK